MKKIVFSILVGGLALVSCSKNNDNSVQDSNIMMQEPEVKVNDSAAATTLPDLGAERAQTPTVQEAAVKVDSAQAK